MPYGYGRGRGFGSGPGWGRGAGMGFGFRGATPPWPYAGIGRGGLPRHAYFTGPAAYALPVNFSPVYGNTGYQPEMNQEEELSNLKNQAETIKDQLGRIASRMAELEKDQG